MKNKIKGTFLALTAAFLWGIMGIYVRKLYAIGLSNYDINFFRCIISGVGYLTVYSFINPKVLKVDRKGLGICIIYGIIVYGLSFLSYNVAVETIPIGVATVLMFMSPIWVSLMGKFIFKDKLSSFRYAMIGICFFGAILTANLIGSSGSGLNFLGILAAIFNGVGMALQIMIPRYFEDRYSCDTMLIYGFLGSAFVMALGTDFNNIYGEIITQGNTHCLVNLLVVSIACTMIANAAYIKAPVYVGTMSTSMLVALEIVVGTIAAYVIYGEILMPLQWLGMLIIVCGIIAFRLDLKSN